MPDWSQQFDDFAKRFSSLINPPNVEEADNVAEEAWHAALSALDANAIPPDCKPVIGAKAYRSIGTAATLSSVANPAVRAKQFAEEDRLPRPIDSAAWAAVVHRFIEQSPRRFSEMCRRACEDSAHLDSSDSPQIIAAKIGAYGVTCSVLADICREHAAPRPVTNDNSQAFRGIVERINQRASELMNLVLEANTPPAFGPELLENEVRTPGRMQRIALTLVGAEQLSRHRNNYFFGSHERDRMKDTRDGKGIHGLTAKLGQDDAGIIRTKTTKAGMFDLGEHVAKELAAWAYFGEQLIFSMHRIECKTADGPVRVNAHEWHDPETTIAKWMADFSPILKCLLDINREIETTVCVSDAAQPAEVEINDSDSYGPTFSEVRDRWGLNDSQLTRLIEKEKLTTNKIGKGRRILAADVLKYEKLHPELLGNHETTQKNVESVALAPSHKVAKGAKLYRCKSCGEPVGAKRFCPRCSIKAGPSPTFELIE